VEAARAHLGDEDIDGPEGSDASQGQGPGGGQEERQAAVGEDALERGPLHHQEVAAGGDQAEGDDGHRVGEEEEQAEHLAPLLPPTPAQVQVGVHGDGLQHGAVQQVCNRQVDDEHIEARPQADVRGEGQDGHQVPHGADEDDQAAPQHGEVPVSHHRRVEAREGLIS